MVVVVLVVVELTVVVVVELTVVVVELTVVVVVVVELTVVVVVLSAQMGGSLWVAFRMTTSSVGWHTVQHVSDPFIPAGIEKPFTAELAL